MNGSEGKRTVRFEALWPPKELSNNARVHWRVKAEKTRNYRAACYLLTLKAMGAKVPPAEGRIDVALTFVPPDRRHRDRTNLEPMFKAGFDGIADALEVNDWRFFASSSLSEETCKHGRVDVEISWPA